MYLMFMIYIDSRRSKSVFFYIVECWSYSTSDLRRTNRAPRLPFMIMFTCDRSCAQEIRLIGER